MKKKYFTLAELIGIITILGIIAVLTIPLVNKAIRDNKEKMYNKQINNMISGLKTWANDNISLLPKDEDIITLTLSQLKKGAYVDSKIINPKTNKQFPNDLLLTITGYNENYMYAVLEDTGSGSEIYNQGAPTIMLKGKWYEKVNLNSKYEDYGVIAKTSKGIIIDDVKIIIKKNDYIVDSINTNAKSIYTITYSVTDSGYTTSIDKLVVVEDMTPPILTVPSGTRLSSDEVASFNVMEGVSAIDNSDENITIISSGNLTTIAGTYNIIYTATDISGNMVTKKRVIVVGNKPLYTDGSGANSPELYDTLIPITYEKNNWVVADVTEKWYDYNSKQWANAILVKEGVRSNYISGKVVLEEDVLTYFVWIPRYSYQLWSGENTYTDPRSINITFQSVSDPVAFGRSSGERLTHPAFWWDENSDGERQINEEKKGIWVGKFETSVPTNTSCYILPSEANCNTVDITPMIKPNVSSWRYININNSFQAVRNMQNAGNIYGLSRNGLDTHMMKNIEWGATVYLSHSVYGNPVAIGKNNQTNFITGCGISNPMTGIISTCNQYHTSLGQNASTTGNIYGVYDMVGGANEYVMANTLQSNGSYNFASSGMLSSPASKYFDKYAYSTSYTDHSRGILGDATREVLRSGNNTWYNQTSYFSYSSGPWMYRGGLNSNNPTYMFHYYFSKGDALSNVTYRIVLN